MSIEENKPYCCPFRYITGLVPLINGWPDGIFPGGSDMWTIYDVKQNGKAAMRRNYWKAVLTALVLGLVTGGIGGNTINLRYNAEHISGGVPESFEEAMDFFSGNLPLFLPIFASIAGAGMIIAILISLFLFSPVEVGCERYFIINRVQDANLGEMGHTFSNGYINVVKTMFLKNLFTLLWSLLLIIPGIIKAYEYRMIPYILAENPNMDSDEAFRLSKEMMDGEKWNAFVYDLSFIGWYILSAFTAGILAVFYVAPYKACSDAELYASLRDRLFGRAAY